MAPSHYLDSWALSLHGFLTLDFLGIKNRKIDRIVMKIIMKETEYCRKR